MMMMMMTTTVQDAQWLLAVCLFLASLLIVLAWLVQFSQAVLRLRGSGPLGVTRGDPTSAWQLPSFPLSHQTQAWGGVWASLLKLRLGRGGGGGGGGGASEAGVKGLLTSLFSFKSFREKWQKAWVQALNEQACRQGSSIQITFDSGPQLPASAVIDSVTCTDQSDRSMALRCHFAVDTVTFPVTVTRQSPAAVSMATYQITVEPALAQVEVRLEEVEEQGLLASWSLHRQPSFFLTVCPRSLQRENKEAEGDLDMIGSLVEDTLFSTQPAMILNLKACVSSPALSSERVPGSVTSLPQNVPSQRPLLSAPALRSSLTPTKKVDVDRTVMPDGTIVTTVTTIQSRPKLDRKMGESPSRSPSGVEVTEKALTVRSDSLHSRASSSPSPSLDSPLSNGLDPVADTAIRQLTESAGKAARKTPTKRSTLIISGVSKVPISEDDSALSLGYAAAMDAALQGGASNHCVTSAAHQQELDEATPSDQSERPSVEDAESETGSTGALETRSLKDHKVGFLRSGTKLLFRRRHRQKDPSFSQSHEDVSSLDNNSSSGDTISRKKSASFSRRLIKRFSFRSSSFRSSSKSKDKASATNGGTTSSADC